MQNEQQKVCLRLALSITDAKMEKKFIPFLEREGFSPQFQCYGQGTAGSELLNICGLGGSDRILTMWVLPKGKVSGLFLKMKEELQLQKRGRGIAVSIPLLGVQKCLAEYIGRKEGQTAEAMGKQEGCKMTEEARYCMIMVTVEQGFSEEVMDTAREEGASGGTIIRGRHRGLDGAIRFWGITLQEEQEILLIVVPREKKLDVMSAISREHGLKTPAHGLVLSIPVDEVMGLEQGGI